MSTPIRRIVNKTLSPRIFKSPNSPAVLNTRSITCDIHLTRSPKIKSSLFSESLRSQRIESDDLEFCRSPTGSRYEDFIIHKPKRIKHSENEINHSLLHVPKQKDIPSVNTPERDELLKTDLSNLNLNILGKGSFGTVVQAMYKDKDVALKIIPKKNTSTVLETNALNLNHPNILKVLLVMNGANHHLVVMQTCCAPDMQSLLDNKEFEVPFQVYSKWVLDVCAALMYSHQQGILHLDVKPKNILVKNNTCLLCDFGNSLNVNSSEQRDDYLVKLVNGYGGSTVAYSAPELLHGSALPTAAADVYALAVTMCHIQTRTPPLQHLDNVHTIIYQVVKHNLRPLIPVTLELFCSCVSRYCALYKRCWAQAPAHRPTLNTVAEQLCQIIYDHDKKLCSKNFVSCS